MVRRIRSVLVAVVVTGLLGLVPFTASAAKPTVSTYPQASTFTIPGTMNSCGFDVTVTAQFMVVETDFTDQSGTLTRVLQRTPDALITFSANGKSISTTKSPAAGHIDLATGTITFTGQQGLFVQPGQGVLGQSAGRQSGSLGSPPTSTNGNFSIDLSGPFAVFPASVCTALSA